MTLRDFASKLGRNGSASPGSSAVGQRSTATSPPALSSLLYRPLEHSRGEIRLLRITFNRKTGMPSMGLVHVELEREMDFIAVSYAWGNQHNQKAIQIDGHRILVSETLRELLTQLMNWPRPPGVDALSFWIDAICINQQDDAEKSVQVRHMSKLYAAAHHVVVWLGSEKHDSGAVLMGLAHRAEETRQSANSLVLRQAIEENPEQWSSVARLFMRPYFTRAWCTQELAFARRINVMTGSAVAPWDALARFSSHHIDWRAYLTLMADLDTQDRHARMSFWLGTPFERAQLIERLQTRRSAGLQTTLLSLLLATVHLQSSIAKDKIYSLWAMASDAAELVPEIDYAQSDAKVFTDFATAWIKRYNKLEILGACVVPRNNWVEGRPSWVPDWSCHRVSKPIMSTYPSAMRDTGLDEIESGTLYSAAGDIGLQPVAFLRGEQTTALWASGLSCDVIAYVGEANTGEPRPPNSWYETVNNTSIEARKEARNDILEALIAGRDPAGHPKMLGVNTEVLMDVPAVYDDVEDSRQQTGRLIWRKHIHNVIAGRRLAVTHKGHVGLVPAEAEVGDEIVVLFGCSVPLVLRSISTNEGGARCYKLLVGDCYFRRMMRGQMVEESGGSTQCRAQISSTVDELQSSPQDADQTGLRLSSVGTSWQRLPEPGSSASVQQFMIL